jgi:hypothetical protein
MKAVSTQWILTGGGAGSGMARRAKSRRRGRHNERRSRQVRASAAPLGAREEGPARDAVLDARERYSQTVLDARERRNQKGGGNDRRTSAALLDARERYACLYICSTRVNGTPTQQNGSNERRTIWPAMEQTARAASERGSLASTREDNAGAQRRKPIDAQRKKTKLNEITVDRRAKAPRARNSQE